jgi:hypothetical protein
LPVARDAPDEVVRPPRYPDPNPNNNREGAWTAEEDVALEELYKDYSHNWPLVNFAFNSRRRGRFPKKSEWECYKRVLVLLAGPVVAVTPTAPDLPDADAMNVDATPLSAEAVREAARLVKRKLKGRLNSEREKRLEKFLATFEYICRAAKKRENIRPTPRMYLVDLIC